MRIEIASYSYQGGREYNEDSVRCFEKDGICIAVVADGLGGHGGGQRASHIAATTVAGLYLQNPRLETETIRQIFDRANDEVLKIQTPTQKMKSTGAALFVKDGAVTWGHAGDSRLYHFTDGRLITQTSDHSVSQMAVFSGEITQAQIRHHDDRNRVLKAFGGGEELGAEIASPQTLESGFHVFLLCTDGFWEYVLETEMEIDLAKSISPEEWINAMIQRLSRRAPRDNDNFSAAAVFIQA
jgi:serine/threonine protein phosphatase PrpC